ncbi:MAG TPA: DUF4190 domain-containing protein, partial [Phycisphaerae bacterium]|nr:DUF4190 domain-containing protein [Phycisphaerae bacterium]
MSNFPNNPNNLDPQYQYQQPQYQTPQGFVPQGPGGPPRVGLSVTAMVLGIVGMVTGLFLIGGVIGIVAIIIGIVAVAQASKNPQRVGGIGFAWTGIITGILSLVLAAVLGVAVMLPSLGRAREISNRSYCSANLTGILKSANVYANDNADDFPIVLPPRGSISYGGGSASSSTADGALAEIYSAGAQRGNLSANLWVLVLKGYTAPKQYLCKSDPNNSTVASPSSSGSYYNNFLGVQNFSYSTAIPWNSRGVKADFWRSIVDASLPLMADMAPHNGDSVSGGTVQVQTFASNPRLWNSPIHGGEGQTVGWSDAHAGFE